MLSRLRWVWLVCHVAALVMDMLPPPPPPPPLPPSHCTVQLNCVVMKGVNDDEICDFVSLTESKVGSLVRSAMCWGCSWGKSVCVRESVWLCPGACGALVMMESRISLLCCSSSGGVGYCLECHLGNTIAYSCMTWRWSKGTSCV